MCNVQLDVRYVFFVFNCLCNVNIDVYFEMFAFLLM